MIVKLLLTWGGWSRKEGNNIPVFYVLFKVPRVKVELLCAELYYELVYLAVM